MKKRLKVLGFTIASSVMLLSTSIYADSTGQSLADIVSNITGKTTAEVTEMKSDGMTYGEIAASSGKLDEFKKETGKENCTGDGTCGYSQGNRVCDGTGSGNGYKGNGLQDGSGSGKGNGRHGNRDGSCINK